MASDIDSAARETYKKTTASLHLEILQNRSVNVANYDILTCGIPCFIGGVHNKRFIKI
jgi:site-specific DNA-cytosine methylase